MSKLVATVFLALLFLRSSQGWADTLLSLDPAQLYAAEVILTVIALVIWPILVRVTRVIGRFLKTFFGK